MIYGLSRSVQAIYVENHAEECIELCVGQILVTIHSMCIDKGAWIKAELTGSNKPEVDVKEEEVSRDTGQESDFPMKESKRKFIQESFKIDENEILNRDAELNEEVIKLFLDNFSFTSLWENRYIGAEDRVRGGSSA